MASKTDSKADKDASKRPILKTALLGVVAIVVAVAAIGTAVYFVAPYAGKLGSAFGSSTSSGAGCDPAKIYAPTNSTATLCVRPNGTMNGYARSQFGPTWTDKVSGVLWGNNGCKTREDILRRDLTNARVDRDGCTIVSGVLDDPYTGRRISFTRGKETSSAVQIDHVVALGNAWVSGADKWTLEKRTMVANDPLNLIAADGPANQGKQDKSADKWMPPNAAFACQYATRQVQVKAKYGLSVTQAEKNRLDQILSKC